MEIRRDAYLDQLRARMWNGQVKVITGIRRCGKSYLLFRLFRLFKNWLVQEGGSSPDAIVELALDNVANARYRNPLNLDAYLRKQVAGKQRCYVFLDEIQYVKPIANPDFAEGDPITFYDVVNGINQLGNVDLYVTGSNSRMLSSDILTEFRGRGDQVGVVNDEERHQREVDFVANHADRRIYVQCALTMPTAQKRAAELGSLRLLNDSFKKICVTNDAPRPHYNEDGILEISPVDFLLGDSLEGL